MGVAGGCGLKYILPTVCTSFWSPDNVPLLLDDVVATNMMYIEVMSHIENGKEVSVNIYDSVYIYMGVVCWCVCIQESGR